MQACSLRIHIFELLLENTIYHIQLYYTIEDIERRKIIYISLQHLREEDYPLRRRFCENFLRKVD